MPSSVFYSVVAIHELPLQDRFEIPVRIFTGTAILFDKKVYLAQSALLGSEANVIKAHSKT